MGQAPTPQSFSVMSGDQLILQITVRDNNDSIVDLTGGTVVFKMARRATSAAIIDSTASPANCTAVVTDASSGLITVTVTDENTDALTGDYYYETKFTDATGREAVVSRGVISWLQNLT